jgi:hypothetical protein
MTFVVVRVETDAEELADRLRHEPRQSRLEFGQNVLAFITHDGSSDSSPDSRRLPASIRAIISNRSRSARAACSGSRSWASRSATILRPSA